MKPSSAATQAATRTQVPTAARLRCRACARGPAGGPLLAPLPPPSLAQAAAATPGLPAGTGDSSASPLNSRRCGWLAMLSCVLSLSCWLCHGLHLHGCRLTAGRLPNISQSANPPAPAAAPLLPCSKYYAVVSVGRQTFTSKRVRRAGARPSAAALASAGAGDGSADGGAAGSEEVAVFKWDEGTDVVLQRGGATVAQVAIYKQGRIDGALGDKLQVGGLAGLACRMCPCVGREVAGRVLRRLQGRRGGAGCGGRPPSVPRRAASLACLPGRSAGPPWTLPSTSMKRPRRPPRRRHRPPTCW